MFLKKGLSMPVNMLVILAVAVLVLLAVVAFFMGGFDPGAIEGETVVNECCAPTARNQELCDDSWSDEASWGQYHDFEGGEAVVTVGGEEVPCSQYVPSPGQCSPCQV